MNTIPDKVAQWDAVYVLGAPSSAERRELEEYLAALPDGRLGAGHRPGFAGPGITSVPDDELMAELTATPRLGPWTLRRPAPGAAAPGRRRAGRPGDPSGRPGRPGRICWTIYQPAGASGHRRGVAALPQSCDQVRGFRRLRAGRGTTGRPA